MIQLSSPNLVLFSSTSFCSILFLKQFLINVVELLSPRILRHVRHHRYRKLHCNMSTVRYFRIAASSTDLSAQEALSSIGETFISTRDLPLKTSVSSRVLPLLYLEPPSHSAVHLYIVSTTSSLNQIPLSFPALFHHLQCTHRLVNSRGWRGK